MRNIRYGLMAAAVAFAALPALAQTSSKEIMAQPASALVQLIQNPDATVFQKAKACQRLAVIGTKDAVPALAALLPDEHLNAYARSGLEGIADPSVDAALRDAATKLKGRPLVGVIDSIGQRKDAQAVGLLKGFLANTDATVASAAAGALGRIGTTDAANALKEALTKGSPVKNWIADGCIACTDGLMAGGKKAEAVALFAAVAKADVAKHIKAAALGGQMRIEQGAAKELLLAQLRNPDKTFFDVGVAVAREMPGEDVTAALVAELGKLSLDRQALLLRAMADRKGSVPMPAVLAASKSESPAVREAAIYVLAKHGDASATAILLDAALGDAQAAQTAQEGLKGLNGQEVDAAILARLANADAKAKVILFDVLASRRIAAAMPTIRQATGDADESVRIAAIMTLGRLAELGDIDLLSAKALADGNKAETNAAKVAIRMAMLRMSDRDACAAKLAERLKGATDEQQVYLLELLGKLSGPKALETVAAAIKSSNPTVKDGASRVLGSWPNAEAAPVLLDVFKNDADRKYQIRALRGYIRIARQLQLPAETKLAMFRTVMESAKRDQEKQLALEVLSRIPSAETLALAASYLGTPALKAPAADVAVKIATKVLVQDPKAVAAAMQKVVDANPAAPVAARAKQLLGQAQSAAK